ncbi:Ubiquitin- modifier 1 [Varicellaria rhodocarpa]|nr:Ubiquitin- modifier 1 [Varicellaria rhodocarpa]
MEDTENLTKMQDTIFVNVDFTGGLEILFSNQRKHRLAVPVNDEQGQPVNMAFLVSYLCQNVMKDRRKEMFVIDGTV